MSRRRVAAPSGFTLIETLMVVVVIGLVAAIAMPRVDTSRYTMNAAARGISSTLSYAQRMAISQQSNINVAFDAVQRGLRVHEDRNDDLAIDAGERVLFHPLPDGVTFGRGAAIQGQNAARMASSGGGATGWNPQWTYDRCDGVRPPPYFPTTGRYYKNRFYEIDPVGFSVAAWFTQSQSN